MYLFLKSIIIHFHLIFRRLRQKKTCNVHYLLHSHLHRRNNSELEGISVYKKGTATIKFLEEIKLLGDIYECCQHVGESIDAAKMPTCDTLFDNFRTTKISSPKPYHPTLRCSVEQRAMQMCEDSG